jgi:hypothetical protein
MRLDDDPDITLAEMLVFASRFPSPLLPELSQLPTVPAPRHIRLPDAPLSNTPLVVPESCLRLVDGPLVGL